MLPSACPLHREGFLYLFDEGVTRAEQSRSTRESSRARKAPTSNEYIFALRQRVVIKSSLVRNNENRSQTLGSTYGMILASHACPVRHQASKKTNLSYQRLAIKLKLEPQTIFPRPSQHRVRLQYLRYHVASGRRRSPSPAPANPLGGVPIRRSTSRTGVSMDGSFDRPRWK